MLGGGAFQLNYLEVQHMANRKPSSYLTGRIFDTVQGCSARGGACTGLPEDYAVPPKVI